MSSQRIKPRYKATSPEVVKFSFNGKSGGDNTACFNPNKLGSLLGEGAYGRDPQQYFRTLG